MALTWKVNCARVSIAKVLNVLAMILKVKAQEYFDLAHGS
jgi:hypothetical protein